MKTKTRNIVLATVAITAVIIASAWWPFGTTGDSVGNDPPTTRVTRRTLSTTVLATGAVKPQVGAEVRVGARTSGKVVRLHANIGDVVSKGQVLAEIEKDDLEAKVRQREAELRLAESKRSAVGNLRPLEIERARADVRQWEASVVLYERELARATELLQAGIASEQNRDRTQEQLEVSRSRLVASREALGLVTASFEEDLAQTQAETDRARAAHEDALVQLSYATITAPIDGVIASVSTQEGETVAAGLNAPTFVTIIDLARLQVDAFVDEVDIGRVATGQEAIFTVDTFPDREFRGHVTAIYPKAVIEENVVNYDVVVTIENDDDRQLRPEMTTNVSIRLESRPDALTVPSRALKRDRGRSVVYVKTPDGPVATEVAVGRRDGQWVEILDGLTAGAEVFLDTPGSADSRGSDR